LSIKLLDITKSFGGKKVLKNLNLDFPDSGLVCVLGNSGSGKTTLLRLIADLETADYGTVEIDAGRKISYVFQNDRLLPGFSTLENVALVSDTETAKLWLDRFELGNALGKKPRQLSGGMRRRVALARAFAFLQPGDILLMDEPFKGLDAELKSRIIPFMTDFAKQGLVILVTHDEKEAALADLTFYIDEL
jgi:NitT/TauT family transport system ATP-binding protein